MLLLSEVSRTPTKVIRAEFVPLDVLRVWGKDSHHPEMERTAPARICGQLIRIRVAPRISLGFTKSKVNVCCQSLGVC